MRRNRLGYSFACILATRRARVVKVGIVIAVGVIQGEVNSDRIKHQD